MALEARSLEDQRREERLAQLRATVETRAQRDSHRTCSHTESSMAYAIAEEDALGPFRPVNGYTTDKLMSDQRFKVKATAAHEQLWTKTLAQNWSSRSQHVVGSVHNRNTQQHLTAYTAS